MARVHLAGSPPQLAQLGLRLTELTRLLQEDQPGPPVPERVVRVAASVLGDVQDCGLTLVRGCGPPATVAWAGRLSPTVDAIQYETGEGPCLQAGQDDRDGDVVLVEDLGADRRWPDFARRCVAETGVRSMVSVRLFLSGEDRGALNLYAQRPAAFDEQTVGTAAVVAPFAALALQNVFREREIAQLHRALHSSRQIGAAVGILMAREQLTSEQAFGQLVTSSQHLNRKLRDIAAEVTQTGALPVVPGRRSGTA